MDIYAAAKAMNEKYGYLNYKTLMEEYSVTQHAIHKVGGIKEFCKSNGYTYRCSHANNPDDIKADFWRVYQERGEISTEIYLTYGKFSKQSIKTAFGSVNNLMKELNIPLNTSRFETKEVVAEDIIRVINEHSTTSATVYRKYGKYCQSVIERIWGSWSKAINELGYEVKNKKVGRERMLSDMMHLYEEYGFLSCPLIDAHCDYTSQAVLYTFGGCRGVESALGLKDAFCKGRSVSEKSLGKILNNLFPDEVQNQAGFDWLRNPLTGYPLHVDFYIPSIATCVEYDGAQHTHFTGFYHKNERDYKMAVLRDIIKETLIAEHGLKLIRIDYRTPLTEDSVKNILSL